MNREFGTTAWGRDWVRLAEPTAISRPDPALPRARSLARNDRVHELATETGRVTATVSDRAQHQVDIALATWDENERDRARALLAGAPPGGDLPDAVHTALCEAGQNPGPEAAELTASCTCRSRRRPCPHILACFFELARRIDERPQLALTLRGLRESRAAPATSRIPLGLLDPARFYGSQGAS